MEALKCALSQTLVMYPQSEHEDEGVFDTIEASSYTVREAATALGADRN